MINILNDRERARFSKHLQVEESKLVARIQRRDALVGRGQSGLIGRFMTSRGLVKADAEIGISQATIRQLEMLLGVGKTSLESSQVQLAPLQVESPVAVIAPNEPATSEAVNDPAKFGENLVSDTFLQEAI